MTPVDRAARAAKRSLKALSRPGGGFDARRYFRGTGDLRFYSVGVPKIRQLARAIVHANRDRWSISDVVHFAERLIVDPYLEVKAVGIEVLAGYRREFTPALLPRFKRWLASNHAANWATTDAICGVLIGPLLVAEPKLIAEVTGWARHRNMWVRRAAAVSVIPALRKGIGLDAAYLIAGRLHPDREDLIQKAVGWMLREAGKLDAARLERYLRSKGPAIPRTTLRYAIERYPRAKRIVLLKVTRIG